MNHKILIGVAVVLGVAVVVAPDDKPAFDPSYETITVKEGTSFEMVCKATGDLPMTYTWYKDNDIIKDSKFISAVDGSKSTLTVLNVGPDDAGEYLCTASNQHGLSSKVYQLIVTPSSGNETDNSSTTIQNIEVVNVDSTTVAFNLIIQGSPESIEARYSEIRDSTEYSKHWTFGDRKKYEIEGLIPGGLYTFKFRPVPSENVNWTPEYNVTLLPAAPVVIIQNFESGKLQINFWRKFDDIMRETIDRHEIKYYTMQMNKGIEWIPDKCAVTIQLPSCAYSTYTISGLGSRTFYEVQLRAHTASGFGEPYKQIFYIP